MKYCAKVFTGNPEIGFLTPGEVLTDEQVARYGDEKIKELCGRGVLTALGKPGAGDRRGETGGQSAHVGGTDTEGTAPEVSPVPPVPAAEEESDELPELGDGDDLISDAPEAKPARKTTKSSGRRK